MNILLTGFEPFGGSTVNASWEAVRRLPSFVSGHEITSFQLPVDFERAAELALLRAEILEADAVLCVGMAAGREKICLEARAVNRMETAVPDNAGFCPRGEAIEEDGPSERLSSMPVSAMQTLSSLPISLAMPSSVGMTLRISAAGIGRSVCM